MDSYPPQKNSMATAALVCGVLGVVFAFFGAIWYVALALSILGIIFGVKGRRADAGNSGLATGGLVCGIVGTVLSGTVVLACTICAGVASCAALA